MIKSTVQFAVETKSGVVQKVGRTSIVQPKTNFKGGTGKWYEEKPKKGDSNNDR